MNVIKTERIILFILLFALITLGAYSNYAEKKALDESKLPKYVEENNQFQKWITNHKNKDINLEADDFRLYEENEVYNSARIVVYPISDEIHTKAYTEALEFYKDIKKARFSPNKEQVVDYRHEIRFGISERNFKPQDLMYLGKRGDRIIENKLLQCSSDALCYIDRAFFVNDDTVVVSTFTLNNEVTGKVFAPCDYSQKCEYVVTLYVMNIADNSALVYKSPPINLVLNSKIEGF
jgi:hypothetical protein